MNRQMLGLLVLSAGIAILIASGANGSPIPGSPIAVQVARAPTAGTCVSSITPSRATALAPPSPDDQDVGDNGPVTYPAAKVSSCGGAVVGEVMSVDQSRHDFARETVGSYQAANSSCEIEQVLYVGSIAPFDTNEPGVIWLADVSMDSFVIGPDSEQRAVGQTWTACVVTTGDGALYRGRLKGALSAGTLPAQFATCWRSWKQTDASRADDRPVSCALAHSIELLALTQITDARVTPAQVQTSCLKMASRAMRVNDPTYAGRIDVRAYVQDGTSMRPETAHSGDGIACVASLSKPKQLVGTLIGLGDKPLPTVG